MIVEEVGTAWGDWDANERFPSGFSSVVSSLSDMGLSAGFWLAPLLFDPALPIVEQNPDWFVDGVTFNHLRLGEMSVLDVTHPDAARYLRDMIQTKVEEGC